MATLEEQRARVELVIRKSTATLDSIDDASSDEYSNALNTLERAIRLLEEIEKQEAAQKKQASDIERDRASVRNQVVCHEDEVKQKEEDRKLDYAKLDYDREKHEADTALEYDKLSFDRDKLAYDRDALELEAQKLKHSKNACVFDNVGKILVGALTAGGAIGAAAIGAKSQMYSVDRVIDYEDGKEKRACPKKVSSTAIKFVR